MYRGSCDVYLKDLLCIPKFESRSFKVEVMNLRVEEMNFKVMGMNLITFVLNNRGFYDMMFILFFVLDGCFFKTKVYCIELHVVCDYNSYMMIYFHLGFVYHDG